MSAPGRRIAIYSDDPDKGGVAQYNHCLALGLIAAGYCVSIVQTASDGWRVREQRALGVVHRWIGYDTGLEFQRTLVETADAERAFFELKPDLVVFSDCCPVSNMAARHVAVKSRIPFVVVVNFVATYLAERFKNCLPVLAGQYAKAREVIAVSTENKQLLHQFFGLPANKGRVIFYGVPETFFEPQSAARRSELRKAHGLGDKTVVSVTAARLTPVKGHLLQVHAMALLQREAPKSDLVAVWMGDGELKAQLEAEIAKMGLSRRIFLAGNQDDMAAWYDMADIFTLTSSSEGMPISIMEAMAKKLAIVATGVSGIPEEIESAGVVLPDPAKDAVGVVRQLARTWHQWTETPAARLDAGRRAHHRASELFRLDRCVRETREVIQGIGDGV